MIDTSEVERVAHLACIALEDHEVEKLARDLGKILPWVHQLAEVDTQGIEPTVTVVSQPAAMREDVVQLENSVEDVLSNAPRMEYNFFVVPKVIE